MRRYRSAALVAVLIVPAGCLIASAAEMFVLPLPAGTHAGQVIAFSPDDKLLVATAGGGPSKPSPFKASSSGTLRLAGW